MKKHKVRAVHDDDLLSFLESIGLRRALDSGRLTCHVCKEQVTLDSLQAVLPLDTTVGVVCSKAGCIKAVEINQERDV